MQYSELVLIPLEDRRQVLERLPDDELADLWDQKPYTIPEFTPRENVQYFDTIEELHTYMLKYYVPASKPWRATEAASHEYAHAACALALGACGVKYYALGEMDPMTKNSIFTQVYGPVKLPGLAHAAIDMHPYTASQSITDMNNIRSLGYRSREHVAARIAQWNRSNHGLFIPEPQLEPVLYPDGYSEL